MEALGSPLESKIKVCGFEECLAVRHQMVSDFLINKYPAIFERKLTVVLKVFPDHLSKKDLFFIVFPPVNSISWKLYVSLHFL